MCNDNEKISIKDIDLKSVIKQVNDTCNKQRKYVTFWEAVASGKKYRYVDFECGREYRTFPLEGPYLNTFCQSTGVGDMGAYDCFGIRSCYLKKGALFELKKGKEELIDEFIDNVKISTKETDIKNLIKESIEFALKLQKEDK